MARDGRTKLAANKDVAPAWVRIVSCGTCPLPIYSVGFTVPAVPGTEFEGSVRAAVGREAATVMEHHPEVVSEPIVCEGTAATELVDTSMGADMLVVGSRGLGGFRGLLLGSVSQQCARHAHCPVGIVPAEERSDRACGLRDQARLDP